MQRLGINARICVTLALLCIVTPPAPLQVEAAKPKKKPDAAAESPAAKEDLNRLSLRVSALSTIYELDMSAAQLHAFRDAAVASASTATLAELPESKDTKLADAFKALHAALLLPHNDEGVTQARNATSEAIADSSVELSDQIIPTPTARAKAAAFVKSLRASQLAAYLAYHADQVSDPVEHLVGTLAELRETEAKDAPAAIESASAEVASLVAGDDAHRDVELKTSLANWLKTTNDSTHALADEDFEAKRTDLEKSAEKAIGDVNSLDILGHWLQNEAATFLSNPQAAAAADEAIAVLEKTPG